MRVRLGLHILSSPVYGFEIMSSESLHSLAQLYDDYSDMQFEHGLQLIKNHLTPKPGQSILDLGCGTGHLSIELAREVGDEGRVVGVDTNKQRVEVARKKLPRNNVSFLEGSVYDAVKWGPFDGVLANFVLHWVPQDNVHSTLRGIYECLKPGGRLVAYITSRSGKLNSDLIPMATGRDEESLLNMCLRFLPFWKQHCIDTGFKVETSSEDVDIFIKFESVTSYFQFVKAYSSGVIDGANISEDDMQELLQKHQLSNASEVVIHGSAVRIVATKPLKLQSN